MSLEHVVPFHGDKEDENPENFLRLFFRCMGTASEDTKKQQFRYFLQASVIEALSWFSAILVNKICKIIKISPQKPVGPLPTLSDLSRHS